MISPSTDPGRPQRPEAASVQSDCSHEFWFIDGRKMDFAIEGVKMVEPHHLGWLLTDHAGRGGGPHGSQLGGLDGALYGVSALWRPQALISDSGGAFTSNEF